jgi:hypothetical protein
MPSLSSTIISNENNPNSSCSNSSFSDVDKNDSLNENEFVLNDVDDNMYQNDDAHDNNSSYDASSFGYLSSSKEKPSWVWSHFRKPVDKHAKHVFCLLCQANVFYTKTHSAGMLERHVKGNIRIFLTSFKNRCKEDSKNRFTDSSESIQ